MCWADETAKHKVEKLLSALLRDRTGSQFFELVSWAFQLKSKSDDKLLNYCEGSHRLFAEAGSVILK